VEQYKLKDGLFQLRVRAGSSVIGAARSSVDLSAYPGISLLVPSGGEKEISLQRPVIHEGDRLAVRGQAEAVARLAVEMNLAILSDDTTLATEGTLFNRDSGLAEVMIPPRSNLVGQSMFPGMVTPSGDLIVLAIQRQGEDLGPSETKLAPGDTLLLQGTWRALDQHLSDPDVVVVDSPNVVRRQAIPLGTGAQRALGVLAAMVVLLATGLLPAVVVGLAAACAMVVLEVVRVEEAYRSINWTTVILVGAMTPLSTAMAKTGAAQMLADGLVRTVGDAGPYALLAGLFVLTAILGQLISNTATALIIIPIAVAAATEIGISPRPVLMSVTVAAAAAFLTPVATPVNLMAMGPGGYRFGDYWKLGLPLLLWFFAVATFVVPLFWSFR
jgi:di/tricarboxylate transporter